MKRKSKSIGTVLACVFAGVLLSAGDSRAAVVELDPAQIMRAYESDIFEKEGDPIRFKSIRKFESKGDEVRVQILFFDSKNEPVSREEVLYLNRKISRYEVHRMNVAESGTVSFNDGKIDFEYVRQGKKKSDDEKESDLPTLLNDMIVPYALGQWNRLMQGQEVEFRLVVADRLETVGFKLTKDHEADIRGEKATVIKMKPTSFIIAGIVKPLYFAFRSEAPHALIEYRGRIVPKDTSSGSAKDFDGLNIFRETGSAQKKKSP